MCFLCAMLHNLIMNGLAGFIFQKKKICVQNVVYTYFITTFSCFRGQKIFQFNLWNI